MHKMLTSLIILVSLSGCAAKPTATPTPPKPKPTSHRPVFAKAWRRTWYQVDAQGLTHTYSFSANSLRYDGTRAWVYWADERTKADRQVLADGIQPTTKKSQWGAAQQKSGWLNIRGWYQLTGSGTSFQLQGAQLLAASGAEPRVYAHFYPTKAQANAHPEQKE